ncbi:MAG: hypothetical protein JNK05_19985 [Myxococcales bacterium]|nr:hypothetical protein [Myxococcales bacterium]
MAIVTSPYPNDPLEVFEAFLHYMRNPPARPGAARPTGSATASPAPADVPEPTRSGPVIIPASVADDQSVWDEPTKSRPDVTREFIQKSARKEPEQSIIVDDDLSMTQPIQSTAPEVARGPDTRGERFCDEMMVLIKYGHAQQVPREIERWVRTYPDDLDGAIRIAEFEMARVDASTGLDRLFATANRAVERGAVEYLRRSIDRLQLLAPQDMRLTALRSRLGLR